MRFRSNFRDRRTLYRRPPLRRPLADPSCKLARQWSRFRCRACRLLIQAKAAVPAATAAESAARAQPKSITNRLRLVIDFRQMKLRVSSSRSPALFVTVSLRGTVSALGLIIFKRFIGAPGSKSSKLWIGALEIIKSKRYT
jgi:hypothetical protein